MKFDDKHRENGIFSVIVRHRFTKGIVNQMKIFIGNRLNALIQLHTSKTSGFCLNINYRNRQVKSN